MKTHYETDEEKTRSCDMQVGDTGYAEEGVKKQEFKFSSAICSEPCRYTKTTDSHIDEFSCYHLRRDVVHWPSLQPAGETIPISPYVARSIGR